MPSQNQNNSTKGDRELIHLGEWPARDAKSGRDVSDVALGQELAGGAMPAGAVQGNILPGVTPVQGRHAADVALGEGSRRNLEEQAALRGGHIVDVPKTLSGPIGEIEVTVPTFVSGEKK